jgi:FixJ family two-component response regulator
MLITRPIHTAADPLSREQTPSAQLQRWENAESIEQLLSELNDGDRRLLDLMVSKKADKEIAAEMGWTEPQAKKRRQRFIQRLRNRFAQGV